MSTALHNASSDGKGRAPRSGKRVSGAPQVGSAGVDSPVEPSVPGRQWRNRIVGNGEEDPEQLLANPKNWRIHPKGQQKALEGILKEVGWVQQVIVNRTTGFVVDGHARVAMAISRGEMVPVVYVELSEEEETLVLATLDPLAAMAGTDEALLGELAAGMSDAHQALLVGMPAAKLSGDGAGRLNSGVGSQDQGFAFKVVVDCQSESDQAEMLERFKTEGLHCRALIS